MYTYKTLIRDKLIANATFKGLFNATASGSCRVNMENLRTTAAYPQVIMSWGGGESMTHMSADEGNIFLTIECQGTGSVHAHKEVGKFRSAILNVLDDTGLSSSTGVCYFFKKFSEVEGYDEDKEVNWLRMGFEGQFKQNFSLP